MEISGASSTAATQSTTIANEVQKKTQDIQKQSVETLVSALPDPSSPVGQNIDVKA